jgi:predicted hydrocarbon binding protein
MEESEFNHEGMIMKDKAVSEIVREIDVERLIFIGGKVVQAIRLDLGNIMGPNVVREIFYRIGANAGSVAYDQFKETLTSEKELWSRADRITRAQGWGRIRLYDKTPDGQKLKIRVLLEDSFFAEGVTSREPVCDIARGGLGKLIALYYDMTLLKADELQCAAKGSLFCELMFELGPKPTTEIR